MPRSLEEDRERKRRYRQEHPDRVAVSQQKNYRAKREQRLAQKREYYARHKEHIKEYQRQYRSENADKCLAQRQRYRLKHRETLASRALYRKTGVTTTGKQELIVQQDGCCAICIRPFAEMAPRHIHTDHCHQTGRARGVLCSRCNLGLGKFVDDPELLRRAAVYLERKEAGLCPIPQS